MAFAAITISGFLLRGVWMMSESDRLNRKLTRIAPHVIDTLFLATGIAMLVVASINPLTQGWITAKFVGLIVYIGFGTLALKRGPTKTVRVLAFAGATATFAYIAGVAVSRSVWSWVAYFSG